MKHGRVDAYLLDSTGSTAHDCGLDASVAHSSGLVRDVALKLWQCFVRGCRVDCKIIDENDISSSQFETRC